MCWNVVSEARIDPPIHTEHFRSGGAITLENLCCGSDCFISFVSLSWIPAIKKYSIGDVADKLTKKISGHLVAL